MTRCSVGCIWFSVDKRNSMISIAERAEWSSWWCHECPKLLPGVKVGSCDYLPGNRPSVGGSQTRRWNGSSETSWPINFLHYRALCPSPTAQRAGHSKEGSLVLEVAVPNVNSREVTCGELESRITPEDPSLVPATLVLWYPVRDRRPPQRNYWWTPPSPMNINFSLMQDAT